MPQALVRPMADVMERVIDQDPAPCMQVNGLAPGYIDTDLTASLVAERVMAGSVGPELMAAAAAAVRRDPPGLEVWRSPALPGLACHRCRARSAWRPAPEDLLVGIRFRGLGVGGEQTAQADCATVAVRLAPFRNARAFSHIGPTRCRSALAFAPIPLIAVPPA
jgi:hypothetical protein